MRLSYRELESFLMELHRVAPEKRPTLRARLKHFQRLGWPAGTNKGKGARVDYGIGQTMYLALGMEMLQLGMTPERVVSQLTPAAGLLPAGFLEILADSSVDAEPIYYLFAPETLSTMRGEGGHPSGLKALMVSRDKLTDALANGALLARSRRFAVINLSELLRAYLEHHADKGLKSAEDLIAPLKRWAEIESEAVDRWNAAVMEDVYHGDPEA